MTSEDIEVPKSQWHRISTLTAAITLHFSALKSYQELLQITSNTMSDLFAPAPDPKTELGRFRQLSSTAGIRCSPLQLGAMSIGDAWSGMMGSMNKEQSFKLLDAYHESGGNFIDTG